MGSKRYDVFLSHRGDFKRGFASFLHARLDTNGITTFFDEFSLQPGDSADAVMTEAVDSCRIGLPVLTESFGTSEWCLRELSIMMQNPAVTVMPIFLDNNGTAVLDKIKAASECLRDMSKPADFAAWQTAISDVGSCVGWRVDQTGGYVPPITTAISCLAFVWERNLHITYG